MPAPRAVIFDMDGLMIDSERLYRDAQTEITASYDKPPPGADTLRKMMGQKPLDSIRILVRDMGLPDPPQEILARRSELMEHKLRTDLQTMPGLREIIAGLRERLPLAVATGSQREFLDLVLEQLELQTAFQVLRCEDHVSKGKPDPEIYVQTVQALGVPAEACIVLEDSENGVRAARGAGCTAWAIPSPYTLGQDFSMAHAQLENLWEALNRLNAMMDESMHADSARQ